MRSTLRPGARARSAAAAAIAVGLVLSGGAPSLAAEMRTPAHAEAEQDPSIPDGAGTAAVELTVAPVEPVIRADDAEVEFDVEIGNAGDEAVPAGTVSLALELDRVADEGSLSEVIAPTEGPGRLSSRLGEVEVGGTGARDEQRTTITVPRGRFLLPANGSAGVYVVRATLTPEQDPAAVEAGAAPAGEISGAAPVVWQGAGDASVPLSVIVPLVLPDEIRTLPTRAQLSELVPRLDELLTRAQGRRATLAIDPRLVAGIRAYGHEAPEEARDFLARLEATSLPSFPLQFADADPAAQAALGMSELMQPESLDFVTRFGKFDVDGRGGADQDAADPAEGDSAGADSAATDPVDGDPTDADQTGAEGSVPTTEQLTSWPSAGGATAWPAEGGVDAGTLSLLEKSEYRTVVLDSTNVAHSGGPIAALGGMQAVVSDAGAAGAARAALSGTTETRRASGAAEPAARLALAAQGKSPGIVLALDRGAVAESEDPAALLQLLATLGWAAPTPLEKQRTGRAELHDAGVAESRLELLRAAVGRESSVDELGAVLAEPRYLTGYQRARLLELFATRHASPDADFEEIAADYRRRDAELLGGVQAASTEHTQLVGTSTQVPVLLHNSLPFDAIVTVEAAPSSAALALPQRLFPDVVVPAEANERVLVPVRSRVSSGESGIVLGVTAASGDLTVYTGTLPISIRSSVEAIALWSLGGLAALLLALGIIRSVRRRRRGVADPETAGEPRGESIDGSAAGESPAE